MSNMLVARRYAKALYEVASSKGIEEKVWRELDGFNVILKDNPQFMKLLQRKKIQDGQKKELISELFSPKISRESINFLHLLIDKKRVGTFRDICSYYNNLIEMDKKQVTAHVKTARQLSDEQKERLIDRLSKVMNKDVKLDIELDQSLIGGISVRLEDKVIDGSIRGYLNKLKSYLDATDLYGAWKDGSDGK